MRMKHLYMPTLREVPAEAEIPSHRLLLRAAMIRKSASGVYSYLPLGYRVVLKIERIVREEMDASGSQEIRVPNIQPREIWDASDRWSTFGPEMFKLKDRHGREFCLGPTAEEYFADLVKEELQSYKQLPLNIYQIGWKYRDEQRPRFGINRSREFLMKDAYSFDMDVEGMKMAYQVMWDAYDKVFDRLGLDYRVVLGDSGAMGGNKSHEFMALSEVGEGVIAYSSCGYAATDEKAGMKKEGAEEDPMLEMEEIATPGSKTIEELNQLLGIDKDRMIKTIALRVAGEDIFVYMPGERELNMSKLVAYLGIPAHEIEFMNDADIERITGSPAGSIGPINLKEKVRLIFDKSITLRKNMVCGANKEGYHLKNVNYGRDFKGEIAEDLWMVEERDLCPECGEALKFARGIEVGNIFQLGTKYSESIGAGFLDEYGKQRPFYMGSYGIGVTRSVSAVVEQNHDDRGIIWPIVTAPYEAIITLINLKDETQVKLAEALYKDLQEAGIEVLIDDRDERAGVKFNDRDLIGIPLRITVGKKADEGIVEFSRRKDMENIDMPADRAKDLIIEEVKLAKSL